MVSDNAGVAMPPDDTETVVRQVDPKMVYIFTPRPLKTLAVWNGLQQLPEHVRYVMHVDDDTVIPEVRPAAPPLRCVRWARWGR